MYSDIVNGHDLNLREVFILCLNSELKRELQIFFMSTYFCSLPLRFIVLSELSCLDSLCLLSKDSGRFSQ